MRKLLLTFMVVCAFVLSAAAQDRKLTGRITNDKGQPIEGVSVISSDRKNGTQTDKDGNYRIDVSADAKTLTFSSINYTTRTENIGTSNGLSISLVPLDNRLDEVVVVGYGVQQKRAFTGAASKVNTRPIAQLITPSFDKELAGRASGVNVINSSGTINAPARIRIRGLGSLSGNRDPLILVDGIPLVNGNLALIGNSNALADINPADIESFDVLKDGASTAIYGSRAANGIIQITTKKGRAGKSLITYDATMGFSNPVQKFELLNAGQFVTIANEKLTNSGVLPAALNTGVNTDWQDYVFTKNAFTQNHTLGISGGTDKTTFYFSFNYSDNQGIVITNKNRTFRVRTSVEHQAFKWLRFGNSITLSRQKDNDQNNGSNALSGAIVGSVRALPNVPIFSSASPTGFNISPYPANYLGQAGNLRPIDDGYTNIAFVLANNRYESDKYRIINNAFAEITPIRGLRIRTQVGIDYFNDNSLQILDGRHGDGFSTTVPGFIYNGQQNIFKTDVQNFANYTVGTRGHNFFFTVGHELEKTTSRFFSASGNNIQDQFFLKENIISGSIAGTQTVGGNYNVTAIESLFGRVNYDYKNKYFLQGSFRRDGQSSLDRKKRYQTFPGVSVGWRPLQERFLAGMQSLNNVITDLKIKGSYSEVGNPLNGYPYLSTYSNRPYGFLSAIAVSAVGNVNLTGEKSIKYNAGVELELYRRVNLSVDVFKNDLNEQVLFVPTPFSAGVPGNGISQNIGTVRNRGIEISADAAVIRSKNFSWNINANWSYTSNKIQSLYVLGGKEIKSIPRGNYNIDSVGQSIGAIYGYEFAGVNSGNGNPVYYNAAHQLVQRNINDGAYYFANSLADPSLGAQTTLSTADKRVLGNSLPRYFGGVTNTFNYKGFGLDVFFRYQAGNRIMNITRQEILLNQKFANGGTELLNRWTTPGQVTDVPRLYYALDANVNQNGEAISRFTENGKFIKLQTITLSYQLPAETLAMLGRNTIKSARFFVQLQNVQTWTRYKGIDPEAYSELGLDNGLSPQVRTTSFGLNVGL